MPDTPLPLAELLDRERFRQWIQTQTGRIGDRNTDPLQAYLRANGYPRAVVAITVVWKDIEDRSGHECLPKWATAYRYACDRHMRGVPAGEALSILEAIPQ